VCQITLHVAQTVHTESCNTIHPRNMVCFRYVIVNTVHTGDNKDDDDDNDGNNGKNNSKYNTHSKIFTWIRDETN